MTDQRGLMWILRSVVVLLLGSVAGLVVPSAASALRNGVIAYGVDQGEETCDQCDDGENVTVDGAAWVETVYADGSRRRRVRCTTGRFSRCNDRDPAFSQDGRRLAIVGARGLVIMRVRGRPVRRLSDFGWSPTWAPGGRRLAYVDGLEPPEPSPNGGSRSGVHVGDLRGRRRLVNKSDAVSVAWSRQGTLAWSAPYGDWPDVWVGDPAGRRQRRVARNGDNPSWSPDGRRVAFACPRGLCVVDRAGTRRRAVTRVCGLGGDDQTGVAWSPDGREIACESRRGSLIAVRLRPLRTRVVVSYRRLFNVDIQEIDWQPVPGR